MRNIEQLRLHLQEANLKIHQLEIERDHAIDRMKLLQQQVSRQENDLFSSRESLRSVASREGSVICGSLPRGERPKACRFSVSSKISNNSVAPFDLALVKNETDFSDGPKLLRTVSANSLQSEIGETYFPLIIVLLLLLDVNLGKNLKMEDEDEDFNNKYLSDLKEGRCNLQSDKQSNADRLSELAWRNSLCPPHLKSSYPAELQFVSPRCVKEEDIKVIEVVS